MPDNWYYYIVLVVLLLIMIVLGFFIGYHYQGDQDKLQSELEAANSKITSLENKMKLDEESYIEQADELSFLKDRFESYKKTLGTKGVDPDTWMEFSANEKKIGNIRLEIIKKLFAWINTTSYPLPPAEELNFSDEETAQQYRDIKKLNK